jgi:hypothetical protein
MCLCSPACHLAPSERLEQYGHTYPGHAPGFCFRASAAGIRVARPRRTSQAGRMNKLQACGPGLSDAARGFARARRGGAGAAGVGGGARRAGRVASLIEALAANAREDGQAAPRDPKRPAFSRVRTDQRVVTSGHVANCLAGSGGVTGPSVASAITFVLTGTAVQRVVAAVTEQPVIPELAEEHIVSGATVHAVRAPTGADDIIALEADDGIVAAQPADDVGARRESARDVRT